MVEHQPEAPRRERESAASIIRAFPRRLYDAVVNGAANGLAVVGASFAFATVIGILGNPIWRWGCWLWNLWP